jgi:hypothetical protein
MLMSDAPPAEQASPGHQAKLTPQAFPLFQVSRAESGGGPPHSKTLRDVRLPSILHFSFLIFN